MALSTITFAALGTPAAFPAVPGQRQPLELLAADVPPPRPAARAAAALTAAGVVAIVASARRSRAGGHRPPHGGLRAAAELDWGELQPQIVDEEALLAESTFPIKPDDLIQRCKEILAKGVGLKDDGADFAQDFEFCAPVVGPIGKEAYLTALSSFKITDGFPDLNARYHFFRVDPFEPNRVWFNSRTVATNTGKFLGKPPTGKALTMPPQAQSMTFNEKGLVTQFTVGYVMDRRVGNTGGLGGAFAFFYGVGKPLPIPECRPYKRSWQFKLLNLIGRLTSRPQKKKEDA